MILCAVLPAERARKADGVCGTQLDNKVSIVAIVGENGCGLCMCGPMYWCSSVFPCLSLALRSPRTARKEEGGEISQVCSHHLEVWVTYHRALDLHAECRSP
jgi:hypothetical protein